MAQKPLVDSDELRQALGLMEHPDVIASLDRAIIGSQIYFEEVLQTKLMKQSNSDNFNIDPKLIYIVPDGYYRLRLRNSFIRETPQLTITLYESLPALMQNLGGRILEASKGDYYINIGKGIVHVNSEIASVANAYTNYINTPRYSMFAKVTYDSGFLGKGDAPEWLKEAISSYVPVLITQKQVTNRSPEAAEIYKTGKGHAFNLMEPYLRDVGFCFRTLG